MNDNINNNNNDNKIKEKEKEVPIIKNKIALIKRNKYIKNSWKRGKRGWKRRW